MKSEISTSIPKAVGILDQEGIVAIPTETVYGLAGNIFSEKAITEIFKVKRRPLFNPLIVHIHSIQQLKDVVIEIPQKAKLLATSFWPGGLTLILKKHPSIPLIVTGGKETVAIRIPNHPLTLQLLKELEYPLAAPSANPFNKISPTNAIHVKNYFGNSLPLILDGGKCNCGVESTIIGFEDNEPILYRYGAIPVEAIEAIIGKLKINNKEQNQPNAPGMLAKHYSPNTKLILTNNTMNTLNSNIGKSIGILSFSTSIRDVNVKHNIVLSETENFFEAASNLYSALHSLDQLGLDLIIAEKLPNIDLGKTINDRLNRASK